MPNRLSTTIFREGFRYASSSALQGEHPIALNVLEDADARSVRPRLATSTMDLAMWCHLGTQAIGSSQAEARYGTSPAGDVHDAMKVDDSGVRFAAHMIAHADSAPMVRLLGNARDELDFVRRWNAISDNLPGHFHTQLKLDGKRAILVSTGADPTCHSPQVARFLGHIVAAAMERMGGCASTEHEASRRRPEILVEMVERPSRPIASGWFNGLDAADPLLPLLARVAEAPDQVWHVEQAAREFNCSPRTFQRKLTQRGLTWLFVLRAVRLHASIDAVISTQEPLTNIAYRCGFADLAHFSRLFKQAAGLPPNIYRALSMGQRGRSGP